MDSAFIISSQKALLQNDQPKQTRNKNLKSIIFFFLLILLIIIACSMFLSSMYIQLEPQMPEQRNPCFSGSPRYYYCRLTLYPELCYDSMSSINTTALKPGPGQIFSDSLQLSINQLNDATISITKALSSSLSNSPIIGPRLSLCQKLVHDSLNRLNTSLGLLGYDSDMNSLSYIEMDEFMDWEKASVDDVWKCLAGLEEIDDMMMMVAGEDEVEEIMVVEEVKLGVEKAKKLIDNSFWLFDRREAIFHDFYRPNFIEIHDDYSFYFDTLSFNYRFLIGMYSVVYLFLALFYFMIWSS